MPQPLPQRKRLPHEVPPPWVPDSAIHFITINAYPPGPNHLAHDHIAPLLWSSAIFNTERGLWWPHLLVVMPDHLHGLFGFARDTGIQQTVTAWKHYNSRTLGISWQRDFFEHRLRHDESFDEKALYIRMNPVRKGLCERPEDWPFCWHMTALR